MEKKLFGTNGVRGIVNKELTPQLVFELSLAIGAFFNSGEVILGRDGRKSSEVLSYLVSAGLIETGCTVYDVGMLPTPALQWITRKNNVNGGVMITASHNPPEYNGIKVMDKDGVEIVKEKEEVIEKIYFNKEWRLSAWSEMRKKIDKSYMLEEYKESIKSFINEEKVRSAKLKVVIDPGNGVGALVTPYLLRELGCKVLTINGNIDGTFPGRLPEPSLENISDLCNAVKAFKADFGVAHDGDADRAIFVDENGIPHWGDRTFALIEKIFLEENPGETIVTPVSSSKVIEDIAQLYGGKIIWTEVGSTIVSRRMQEINAKLGGEENGGIFYAPHIPVRDGAMAAALITNILAETKKSLSQLLNEIPLYYSIKTKVECPHSAKLKVLEMIKEDAYGEKIEVIDGVKIWFSDSSWILIRPSGTEPIYRLFAEAKTEEQAKKLISHYMSKIKLFIEKAKEE
ncbi:MAG: phosphoglucosamine mutase [Candidatus Bathyarchaeia archaeon]|nr:phosphoglucosamine mutase [Candidatus Bathyarchaeota archaeon]